MKRIILAIAVAVSLTMGIVLLTRSGPNTGDTIIKMAEKGSTESEMLAAVSKSRRDALTADEIIRMNRAGVPNSVISEMLHQFGSH